MAPLAAGTATFPDPLRGVVVVSIATNVPGPAAAARLRSLGAQVTKVEPPAGDYLAVAAPGWYEALCTGQEVITIDLKSEAGRASLDGRLARADVLITSHRPSALARLGLDAAGVLARFTRLCVVAIVGEAGAGAERAGHDLTYQAGVGLVSPPAMPQSLFSDLATGEAAATAALALVVQRARTGTGGVAEVALADVAARLAAPRRHGVTLESGVLGGALPVYAVYAAASGWVAVAALEPHFMQRLASGLGLDDLTHDALAAAFLQRDAEAWDSWGRAHDVPVAAVRGP
ncbi:MAG: CoA transferase [Gemmatimonadetes bacterium]|nr:CoA transferase [Gemmatimonadota bacterium]